MQQSDLVKLGGTSAEEGKGYSITEEGRRRDKERGMEREEGRGSLFARLPAAAKVSATLARKSLFSPSDLGDRDATHIISATL